MASLISLPFDNAWPEIEARLKTHRNLVLVAEPGAGKTTRFPAMLLEAGVISPTGQVVVLEPRRLAARAAAMRIADEREWPLKTKVGYSVRFDHQLTPATPLGFLTEGLFLKRLAQHPTLPGVECVVLDEFHERSRHTDLAIAALKELQLLERPDLRIVVMSATIDADKIAAFLSIDDAPAPIIRVPGRTFPIDTRHTNEPLMLSTSREWTERIARVIQDVVQGRRPRLGDVLTFVPGVGEIRRLREILEGDISFARATEVLELHGSLSLDEQARVLKRHSRDDVRPRVILATNIAETSLTIDGVGTVIDTGLARVARADRLGFSQLHLERISLASARQRAGRAGRQAEGLCYRMWSKLDENSFPEFDEAELNRIDLTDSLLDLYSLGVGDPRNFDWFEKPDTARMQQALKLLGDLGAVAGDMRLTSIGRKMHQTGLPARAARMTVAAADGSPHGSLPRGLAAVLSGLLTEKDFLLDARSLAEGSSHECDLYLRASLLTERHRHARIDHMTMKTVRRVIESLLTRKDDLSLEHIVEQWDDKTVAGLLLAGFPDRVARRRRAKLPQARMAGGKGVELHPASTVREAELFFALKGDAGTSRTSSDPMTTMASALSRAWLEDLAKDQCRTREELIFDDETLTVYKERAVMYRDLPLENGARGRPDPNDAFDFLKAEALKRKSLLTKEPPVARLEARLDFLRRDPASAGLFENTSQLATTFEQALEERLFGQTSLKPLLTEEGSEGLAEAWERALAAESSGVSQALRDRTPSHFKAPTGNRFRIEYPPHQPPFVEVRLQELFGTREHPMIAGVPLTFHLLGPNYRPVQVTSDLPGFWKGTYFEVRKELRARYPKHSWPENPLEAPPEAKGRRRF